MKNLEVGGAILSDHAPVSFSMPYRKPVPRRKEVMLRNIKDIDLDSFRTDISQSTLCTDPPDNIADLVDQYNTTLSNVLNTHAPARRKVITIKHQSPWYTEAIHKAKRKRRRAERQWRSTHLAIHLEIYRAVCAEVTKHCRQAKQDYYCQKIEESGSDQRKIFQIANELMNKTKDTTLPSTSSSKELAEKFADFFTDKIAKIRDSFEQNPTCMDSMNNQDDTQHIQHLTILAPTTEDELRKIICSGNSKTCGLDPLPTQLLKSVLDVLLPVLCKLVNASLTSSTVPSSLKSATVSPLLKKSTLNPEDMKNYRPVSNLSYISKLIEKVVVKRLNAHMTQYNLHEYFQSAYRQYHSTETALLRVHNDILQALDNRKCVYLVLLDLSAAFDTIEHSVLLQRFDESLGITETALAWCRSYFMDRYQAVNILGFSSVPRPLTSGMPQGSVMGPFGFPSYTGPVGRICERHGIRYHFYADDTQLYLEFDIKDEADALKRLEACIEDIRLWMKSNFLKLNESKTEFLILGSKTQHQKLESNAILIGSESIQASSSARNIGAVFDSTASMKEHVQAICRACYCHVRNIGKVRRNLTRDATINLVHAFIASKIDQMNCLLYGIPKYLVQKMQKIQNNAARIVSRCGRREHITPILSNLHWLPVTKRIDFKILLITFKALNGLAPGYIHDLITPYQPSRSLRSLNLSLLRKPKSRTLSYGDRSFAVAAPSLWNKLPLRIRQIEDLDNFKSELKTHMFRQAYQ